MQHLGTSKALYIYYEDAFYDITPLATAITGATFTVTVNKASNGEYDFKSHYCYSPWTHKSDIAHGLQVADYVTITSNRRIIFFCFRFCKN